MTYLRLLRSTDLSQSNSATLMSIMLAVPSKFLAQPSSLWSGANAYTHLDDLDFYLTLAKIAYHMGIYRETSQDINHKANANMWLVSCGQPGSITADSHVQNHFFILDFTQNDAVHSVLFLEQSFGDLVKGFWAQSWHVAVLAEVVEAYQKEWKTKQKLRVLSTPNLLPGWKKKWRPPVLHLVQKASDLRLIPLLFGMLTLAFSVW